MRQLFGSMAMFYAVGAGAGANLTAPETLIGPIPQLNFATTIDTGGFLQNSVAAGTILTDGAYFDGASWIAKDTGAVVLQMNGSLGGFIMYANSSLTPGVAFAPVTVLQYLGYGSPYEFITPLKVSTPAFTGLTASTEFVDADFATNRTVQFATGALALQRASIFRAPTYSFVGASTLANSATLAIDGPPVAGANATLTKTWGLLVGTPSVTASANATNSIGLFGTGTTYLIIRNTGPSLETVVGVNGTNTIFGSATGQPVQIITNNAARLTFDALGKVVHAPGVGTSGVLADWSMTPAANTGMTAATESNVFRIGTATRTWATTGTVALQRDHLFQAQTYASAGASQTFTDAVTFAVEGPPLLGANTVFTRRWAATFGTPATTSIAGTTGTAVGIFGSGTCHLLIRNTSNVEGLFQCTSTALNFGSTSATTPLNIIVSNNTRAAVDASGKWTFTPGASTSGVVGDWVMTPGASTGITASAESNVFRIGTATRTWATTGTVVLQRDYLFSAITYSSAAASQTFTDAATFAIDGPPVAGANAIITRGYALMVQSGDVQLAGSGAALATNATTGFTHLPTCAGTPTGVPAALKTGAAPMVFDTTGSKIWIYIGGAWKGIIVA